MAKNNEAISIVSTRGPWNLITETITKRELFLGVIAYDILKD